MEGRKTFVFFRSYYDALKSVDDPYVVRDALMAICAYALDGEVTPLSGMAAAFFSLVRPSLEASRKKAEAGRAGGLKKAPEKSTVQPVKHTASKTEANRKQNGSNSEAIKDKGLRIKDIPPISLTGDVPPTRKKQRFGEFVQMTQDEYQNLSNAHGEQTTRELIQILDDYKGSTGKKYKSDYRAILSWVVTAHQERQAKLKSKGPTVSPVDPTPIRDGISDVDRMFAEIAGR